MSDWEDSDYEDKIETTNVESKYAEKEMNREVHIADLLQNKDNFVDNPYRKVEMQGELKALKDADQKYEVLKDKYHIDLEHLSEAQRQSILAQVESDDFTAGLFDSTEPTYDFTPTYEQFGQQPVYGFTPDYEYNPANMMPAMPQPYYEGYYQQPAYNRPYNQQGQAKKASTPAQPVVPKVLVDENTQLDKLSMEEIHSVYKAKLLMLKTDKWKYFQDLIDECQLKEADIKKISDKSYKIYQDFLKKKDAQKKNKKDQKKVTKEKYEVPKQEVLEENITNAEDYNEDDFM